MTDETIPPQQNTDTPPSPQSPTPPPSQYLVPGSIIIAGMIIAGAVMYSGDGAKGGTANLAGDPDGTGEENLGIENIVPVNANDHIFGSASAQVKLVEFSDMECPFCKRFHETALRISQEYGGKVAWVYRHFPLDSLHSKARTEAHATECASELGGNDAFWKYTNKIFEITPSNDGLDLNKLPKIAKEIGLDEKKFNECMESNRHEAAVEEDYQDSIASGGRGTPYSVVISASGKKYPIHGAQPYESVKQTIEKALSEE